MISLLPFGQRYLRYFTTYRIEEATKSAGYTLQKYETLTRDGYKLTLHRLDGQGQERGPLHRTPVLMQHGMWSSSENWIVQGPKKSLGYILNDAGFDVWLGNTRGNIHSRQHLKLSPEQKEYWDFSWHEMGVFDLPAMIDRILSETGKSQLYYIGHSQGTTIFFVMASERPEYNAKIRAMVALAPVAYLNNMANRVLQVASFVSEPLHNALRIAGIHKLFPDEKLVTTVDHFWRLHPKLPTMMAGIMLSELSSYATEYVRVNVRDVVMAHISSGTSSKGLAHFAQVVRRDFRQFDYGPQVNRQVYGKEDPPAYKLKNVSVPVVAFYSEGDWLTKETDVKQLTQNLGGEVFLEKVNDKLFNHQDFIWADVVKFNIMNKLFRYLFYFGKI